MNRYAIASLVAGAIVYSASAAHAAQIDQVTTFHSCTASDPAANEVYIYQDANFGGVCAALYGGFYPNSGSGAGGFGLPNDSISSLKVGSAVRARLFADGGYGGSYYWFGGWGQYSSMPSGWNDAASSIRVEDNSRSTTCNDLQPGEFSLFRGANFSDDCVVLFYGHSYAQPANMGIANDSISSVNGGPQYAPWDPNPSCSGKPYLTTLYSNGNYGGSTANVGSGTVNSYLSSFNDVTSSVGTYRICL